MDAVFVNTILSGVQQRNLEASSLLCKFSSLFLEWQIDLLPLLCDCQRAWDKPVLDRVGLIIEIFNAHAFTKEAKLQVQSMAPLSYFIVDTVTA